MGHHGRVTAPPADDASVSAKGQNEVLGVYDLPLRRDWMFWNTVAWTILIAGIIASAPAEDGRSPWPDALLAGLLAAMLLGFLPAALRRLLRGLGNAMRSARSRRETNLTPRPEIVAPSPPAPAASFDRAITEWSPGSFGAGEEVASSEEQATSPLTPASEEAPIGNSHPSSKATPSVGRGGQAQNARESQTLIELGQEEGEATAVLTEARERLPYPIARAARALQLASDPRDSYEATLQAGDAINTVLGVVAATWLLTNEPGSPSLDTLHKAFGRGVSGGVWHEVIRDMERQASRSSQALPGSVEAIQLGKGGIGLLSDLRGLLEERNKWAHGAGPHTRADAATRLAEMRGRLIAALERCGWLANAQWILTERSSYKRSDGRFEVEAYRAMGDHPEFERTRFSSSAPMVDDNFYIMTPSGPLDLTPFVVIRYCVDCRQREVFFADRINERRQVVLKSFANGHVVLDDTLAQELDELLPSASRDA